MSRKVFGGIAAIGLIVLTACTTTIKSATLANNSSVETIASTSGTPQSHAVNAAFGMPLVATITTNGAPAAGIAVTFTAPATGPSCTFSNTSSIMANAITDSNGIATSPAVIANGAAGSYVVTATAMGILSPASFNLTNTTGAPASVSPTSGTPQSAPINTAFPVPFAVSVVDSGQNPVSGAIVTFTAPASGASGLFSDSNSNVTTAATNSNGIATSASFTANGISGADIVIATVAGVASPATFSLTNAAGAAATIAATNGTPQSAQTGTAFSSPLVAAVLDSASNPVAGVVVTFSAPTTGASGTFANGTTTEMDTTDASGMATSSTFTANATAGGPYTVTASIAALPATASFSLTNRVAANTYVFYLSGQESIGPNFYALAGSVEIDSGGNVLAGEQDYNDALGFTSPQPSGDSITGGSLAVDPTSGQGLLTLTTNNTALPNGGTEVLGVQFVNSNHALIMQFDGSATSSGGMDRQASAGALTGGFAFTLSGVDDFYGPAEFGGVFSITGGNLQNGAFDTNDNGNVIFATPLSGTISTADSFGRGTISSTLNFGGSPIALNYYVVGPEALRMIDVNLTDSGVGSAFGQGINATNSSNSSIGNSVFAIQGGPYIVNYATVGMFTTSPSLSSFSGVADDNEVLYAIQAPAAAISGSYAIGGNGYGSLTINAGALGDVSLLGVYLTDPSLNLNDPNNATSGLGGALIADMDAALPGGTGLLVPQTDTSIASFTGNYAFGAQDFNAFCCELDFVAQGSVTNQVLNGTGFLGDPFLTLGASATNSNVAFSGSPLADNTNVGRYSMSASNSNPNPFKITINGTAQDFEAVLYQANGGQLFWLDEDVSSVFLGSLQQQGSLTGLPAARKSRARNRFRTKQ